MVEEDQETLLYSMTGTQFGAKVLAALDALRVPYRVVEVDFFELKKRLAPPHTIPQMRWRGELLTDSSDILKHVDEDHIRAPFKLYPASHRQAVERLEQTASIRINAHVLYYTWWVEHGFRETALKLVTNKYWPLPAFLVSLFMSWTVDIGRIRGAARKKVRGVLGEQLITPGRHPSPDEELNVKVSLLSEIRQLEDLLRSDEQQYLCATPHPTAADFSVYAMIERLVGENGDSGMGVVAPWLWAEAQAPRLRVWYARMRDAYPIRFKGKEGECRVWASGP